MILEPGAGFGSAVGARRATDSGTRTSELWHRASRGGPPDATDEPRFDINRREIRGTTVLVPGHSPLETANRAFPLDDRRPPC